MRNRRGESRTQHIPRIGGRFRRAFPNLGRRRFSANPIPLGDEPAGALLRDILDENLERRAALEALLDWVRRALRSAKRRDSLDDNGRDALFGPRARTRIDYRARKHARKLIHGPIHLDD
jgi:hypothetical protein